jgi:hypothetical protein
MLRQRDRRDKLIHLEIPQSAPRVAFLFAWKIVDMQIGGYDYRILIYMNCTRKDEASKNHRF